MKIGDEILIHGYIDEIRKDTIIVRNDGGYFGTVETEIRPVEKEQKTRTGHWIITRTFPAKLYDEYLNEYECSECKRGIRCTQSQLVNYPYCHCGAKMEE